MNRNLHVLPEVQVFHHCRVFQVLHLFLHLLEVLVVHLVQDFHLIRVVLVLQADQVVLLDLVDQVVGVFRLQFQVVLVVLLDRLDLVHHLVLCHLVVLVVLYCHHLHPFLVGQLYRLVLSILDFLADQLVHPDSRNTIPVLHFIMISLICSALI